MRGGMCAWVQFPTETKEDIRFPGAGVIYGHELPNVAAMNQTRSSAKAEHAAHHWAISPAPSCRSWSLVAFVPSSMKRLYSSTLDSRAVDSVMGTSVECVLTKFLLDCSAKVSVSWSQEITTVMCVAAIHVNNFFKSFGHKKTVFLSIDFRNNKMKLTLY